MLTLYDLSVGAVRTPATVPCRNLRFGWKLGSDRQNTCQTSYRITLTEGGHTLWDTGEVVSARSIQIPCDVTLPSRADVDMTVTVTDNHGETATARHSFATALEPEDWVGQWIKPKLHIEGWAPYLRTKFSCRGKEITHARLYVSGLGCGEYYINGQKISEDLIDPPMTNYEKAVFYRVYDVKPYLGEKNTFAALLGEGWYSQSRVWAPSAFKYGDVCLMAQLEITYADGETQTIATGESGWKYKYSPIVLNNLYGGETYDSRLETPDFSDPDGDEEGWSPVMVDPIPKGTLTFCEMPPVRIIRQLPAVSVRQVSGKDDGAWIIDLGENFAGFAEFHIPNSPRGAQYVFRFAETINPDGSLDFRSIGSFAIQCIQQDVYIARGDAGGETWRPRFTYHAFRYIEITGYHDLRKYGSNPELTIATGYALSTDLEQTGTFESAHEDLNHLQRIMMSTFRSNYHGYPEDCPGREKCGWLGDAQVVCNTGMMNYDLEASYEKYLRDIRSEDDVYGVWQMIAPGKRGCGEATPLWGCAQIIIPYWMYRYYGNEAVVRENWDKMKKWVQHEVDDAARNTEYGGYIITRGLGDWCPPCGHSSSRRIPVPESSTQMFYEICLRMSELADALGLDGKAYYDDLAAKIKDAYIGHFWNAETHAYSTWGSCGVALMTGLYPEGEKQNLLHALVGMIRDDDFAMSTGIYGNKYLIPALSENGYGDMALRYMFTRDHTSFGTMMDDGATSLWECLELKGIGQPRESGTASFNHPMHAGFAYFLYADVAGIRPLTPGFSTFEINPCHYDSIPSATVTHICPYGKISLSFTREGDKTAYTFEVPVNTTCHFRAGGRDEVYGSGVYSLTL